MIPAARGPVRQIRPMPDLRVCIDVPGLCLLQFHGRGYGELVGD